MVSRERGAPQQAAWGSPCCLCSEHTGNEGKQEHLPWDQALKIAIAQHLTEALKTGKVDPTCSRYQEVLEGQVSWKQGLNMGAVLG